MKEELPETTPVSRTILPNDAQWRNFGVVARKRYSEKILEENR